MVKLFLSLQIKRAQLQLVCSEMDVYLFLLEHGLVVSTYLLQLTFIFTCFFLSFEVAFFSIHVSRSSMFNVQYFL
jgi:hypothetical protein